VQSASIVVGPAIGALLLAVATPTWSFVANAGTFAVGALLTATVATRSRGGAAADATGTVRRFLAELTGGARVLRESPVVRVLTSLAVGTAFVYGTQTVVLVIVAGERVGHSASSVGVLYVALGLGGLVGAPIGARLAHHPRLGGVALVALGVAAMPVALLWPVHNATLAFVLVTISGVGQVVVDVVTITQLQRTVANEVTGRVFGIVDALTVGGMIVGSLLVAPLRNAFGFGAMLFVVAAAGPALVLAQARSLVAGDRDAELAWSRLRRTVDDLQHVTLFAPLREGALERLARGAVKERFAVGETIVREGERGTTCYAVLHGRVAVRRGGPSDEIVATLQETDHFGEIGMLHGVPRTATVTAATDCVLYAIDAETFRAALDADALVASQALEAAATRLSVLAPAPVAS